MGNIIGGHMMKFCKILALGIFLSLMIFSTVCAGTISLPWANRLDCSAWMYDGSSETPTDPNCSMLNVSIDVSSCGSYKTTLSVAANNTNTGSPGVGIRQWIAGSGVWTDGFTVDFTGTTALEVRWYMKYQSGFTWSDIQYHKVVYILTTSNEYVIPNVRYSGSSFYVSTDANGVYDNLGNTVAIPNIFSPGDGLWHLYELNVTKAGAVKLWIDEVQVINTTASAAFTGNFTQVQFGSNIAIPNNASCYAVDFDDLAINGTGAYIGPVSGSTTNYTITASTPVAPTTFPIVSVIDNFNRANNSGPPSASWTDINNALMVYNNTCMGSSAASDNVGIWNVATFGPDCEAYTTYSTVGETAVILRTDSLASSSGYLVSNLSGAISIYRMDTWGVIYQTTIAAPTAGDKFGARMIGNVITVWYNRQNAGWTQVGSYTDSSNLFPSAGYIGLDLVGTTMAMDDFGGGTIPTHGTISPLGDSTVASGGSKTYTITPDSGYTATVLVDGASVGSVSSYTFSNVTANHTISATFTTSAPPVTYTITATQASNGTISPAGVTTVNSGASQTYTITANSGYTIFSITVDGVVQAAAPSWVFSNVTANHTITAAFAAVGTNPTITATQTSNGTISPGGVTTVTNGSSQTYTITPSAKYVINTLTIDGTQVLAQQSYTMSYTFTNVVSNHTITATYSFIGSATAGSLPVGLLLDTEICGWSTAHGLICNIPVSNFVNAASGGLSNSLIPNSATGSYLSATALTTGSAYYQAVSGLTLARANSASTMPAVCVATSATVCLYNGIYRYINSQSWTVGGTVYLSSSSAGALTQTAPSGAGTFIQKIGTAIANDTILIMPTLYYVTN
jgi:hypothetical protein